MVRVALLVLIVAALFATLHAAPEPGSAGAILFVLIYPFASNCSLSRYPSAVSIIAGRCCFSEGEAGCCR